MENPLPPQSQAGQTPFAAALDALGADDLIDLYFEAEDPGERDVVFARLKALREPTTDTFLLAMLAHDDDIFLRLAAAAELMARGYEQAREVLMSALYASGDDEVFEEAMDALIGGLGAELFADLAQIYGETERDPSERLAALRGMERCDPLQAQAVFLAALEAMPHEQPFDPAALEVMLGCFVREQAVAASATLTALLSRLPVDDDEASADARRTVAAARAVLLEQGELPA